jgi:hypothetical protein
MSQHQLSTGTRQHLVAILAADAASYSRLMAADEEVWYFVVESNHTTAESSTWPATPCRRCSSRLWVR